MAIFQSTASKAAFNTIRGLLPSFFDVYLEGLSENRKALSRNPFSRFGMKCFSQSDEDGLTLEIVKRLDLGKDSVFVELGVGDGLENNTLILKALGWSGIWIGAQDLKITLPENLKTFVFSKSWVTLENASTLIEEGKECINASQIDLLSIDLDGNDFYFLNEILTKGCDPKIIILEYNAKFPPPVSWIMPYSSTHTWQQDDYFGASLSAFDQLLSSFEYSLICCNSQSGANAFYVKHSYLHLFPEVPDDIGDIFVPPRYHLPATHGHKPSLKTIESIFKSNM